MKPASLLMKSPLCLLAMVAGSIFISEIISMLLLHFLRPLPSEIVENLLDSTFLLIMLSPILYIYMFRPLLQHINEREKAEESLRQANDLLETRIKARTSELQEVNKGLQKAYEDLKAAQMQILQQEKMATIGQISAGVAHEINNPVGYISSNLGSLRKYADKIRNFVRVQTDALEELSQNRAADAGAIMEKVVEQRHALKIDSVMGDIDSLFAESFDGIDRVKKIVQDLKSFSRVDGDEFKMADINAGIESTLNVIWNELKYKTTVRKEFSDIPHIKCNPGQLNQVFMNLLVNAAHAIEEKGEIAIKTWSDDSDIFVSVSDTGCGIPKEITGKIFDAFFTTKEVGKGTGLGLSIASDIVRKHDGEISVMSEPGKGTTFTIRIPIVKE